MESPVRIWLSAAVVLLVLLLLCSTSVSGNALPLEITSTTIKNERNNRLSRLNGTTWVPRNKPKNSDVLLNELNPKESSSEENTDKNAKYKDRGRVKYNSQITSTPRLRVKSTTSSTTEPSKLENIIIVTPTPEVKKPSQIIDDMKTYKKTKLPMVVSSSTKAPVSIKTETENVEEEDYEDEEEEKEAFEKYTSSKFHDSNFFTIPSFNSDFDSNLENSDIKEKPDYSIPSFDTFSSLFPSKDGSYEIKDDDDPYKSESFFDFELTTPKNDFFDKKFHKISSSIMKNLASIKTKSPPSNATNVHKIVKEDVDLERLSNGSPNNKSTVIIKNTKEIRLLDNEEAGSANKELSDVHGTSIYYEMSVLSTETYAINHSSDDDCDTEKLPSEPTSRTSAEEEFASVKATVPTLFPFSTTQSFLDKISGPVPTLSTNFVPVSSSVPSIYNSIRPIPMSTPNSSLRPIPTSTQNSVSSTEKVSKVFSSNFSSRNRSYSKRLNLSGNKDSVNSVTSSTNQVSPNHSYRTPQRKFHYTTPKIKPIWMAPRRNITRPARPSSPSTIYSEHFNIKDKFFTTKQPNKKALTTVSSDIDPVLQSDISGIKKVVHSPTISDNSIPTLWKRGSTKYSTSTASSSETETGLSDLEIPPTLTAWALASLRSPPSLASPAVNVTGSTQKSVDENDLQKVGEIGDKQETTTGSTVVTTVSIPSDDLPKKVTDIDQNRLPWKPIPAPMTPSTETTPEAVKTESKSERLPAESNISNVQSTVQVVTTTESTKNPMKITYPSWIPATTEVEITTNDVHEDKQYLKEITESSTSVNVTKPIFESITKLPSGITTPQDDTLDQGTEFNNKIPTQVPATTDYEITTIRFSYVPTETETEVRETESTTTTWHKIVPTRTKITSTTLKDIPITTYRPDYVTTTEVVTDSTTVIPETSSLEVSSQVIESTTSQTEPETTETVVQTTTEEQTEAPTTKQLPVETTSVADETTTITVEVVTEINTEREKPRTSTTEPTRESETTATGEIFPSPSGTYEINSNSEENSGSNEVITQETTKMTPLSTTPVKTSTTEMSTTTITEPVTVLEIRTTISHVQYGTTEKITTEMNDENANNSDAEVTTEETETTTDIGTTTKSVNELEDLTSYTEMTTEASSRVLSEQESGSGAAVAIAVSTIGVIALILLIGLLLVVRRRGRRGVYAQRCTPVSLDAYSLGSVSVGHRKGNHRLRASKRSYGNPAYDDEVTSHPMQYAALVNFAMDIDSIAAEFSEIPSVTVRPDEVPPGCEDKNRYSNVLPLPETRVPLSRIGNDPTTEYINANYITGPGNIRNYYIACQAPLPNTVVDFWRMIWEQNSRVIVMLTEYMENGVEKCYEYLPPSEVSDNKRTFGDFQIILKKREQRDKYAISSVQFVNLSTRSWREVTHLWYFWPAKGVPDDYDSVIDFLSEIRSYMKMSQTAKEYDEDGVEVIYGDQSRPSYSNLTKLRSDDSSSGNGVNVYSPSRAEEHMRRGLGTNGTLSRLQAEAGAGSVRPCVVLCASGAGRTGALIALDICTRALAAAAADVPRVVRELRAQRPHALANRNHYIFLYKVLSEYGNRLMGGGVDNI